MKRVSVYFSLLILCACGAVIVSEIVERRSDYPTVSSSQTSALGMSGCDETTIGADSETRILSAYRIGNGTLGTRCLGTPSVEVRQAFEMLALVMPQEHLRQLDYFAGFAWLGDSDETTYAYVISDENSLSELVMAINIAEFDANPDDALLTLTHEFAHILTWADEQRLPGATVSSCTTFWNGIDCLAEDALLWRWILAFWSAEALSTLTPGDVALVADGEGRCALDDSFFGPYAASHPEEDFAEAFAAYVLGVRAETPGQQKKISWMSSQSALQPYRTRALEAGFESVGNTYEVCG